MDYRLQENLKNVQHNYLAPFLWLHWEDDMLISEEIQRIYDSGIRSVCLESRTHDDFVRDGWWEDLDLIFEECRKRDMNVWILDDKHFPSGYANGVYEGKREYYAWGITEEHMSVPGPVKDGCVIADMWLRDEEDELISVVALKHVPSEKRYTEMIDLTDNIVDGMIYFDLPEGTWQITTLIKSRRGIQPRFLTFCDKLNPNAVQLFIDEVYQPHYDRYKEYFGNTFMGFFSDEPGFKNNSLWSWRKPEFGLEYEHHPWGDCVINRLREKHGDKARALLAGLWFDVDNISSEIRYEFMDIVTDEYRKNFINPLADWCHDHGVMYIGHIIEDNNLHAATCNGPGHYFRALDHQDMSGIDVVLHQIVPGIFECSNTGPVSYHHMNNEFFQYYLAKLGSSFAHIDPLKQGRAMCEIFGAYGWAEGTKVMKYLMDHMLVRGINFYVPHAFSPKENDPDCPPTFYDRGGNPEFMYFGDCMNYLNRMCHIIGNALHISDCAIFYDAENRWTNGNFLPLENIAKVLYDNMTDYDIVPEDYIGRIDSDGRLNGEKYNVLLVPYSDSMPADILKLLEKANLRVVFVVPDNIPFTLPFEWVELSKLTDFMSSNNYRHISSDYPGKLLRFIHFVRDGAHICMFNNEDIHNAIDTHITLDLFGGGEYIEYDCFKNNAVKKSSDGKVHISLAPYNSTVLIFGDCSFELVKEDLSKNVVCEKSLDGEYTISLARGNSTEFEPYTTTDTLFNITGKNGVRDFSGHMKYETSFDLAEKGKYILDLGYAGEIAQVYVNGQDAGKKLFPPYEFDISDYAVAGKNKLDIIITNHNGYSRRDYFSAFMLMEASGLIGPVVIKTIE